MPSPNPSQALELCAELFKHYDGAECDCVTVQECQRARKKLIMEFASKARREQVEELREIMERKPSIPEWSHSSSYWIYRGEQFVDGKLADHRWLQDLSRWADEIESKVAALAGPEGEQGK